MRNQESPSGDESPEGMASEIVDSIENEHREDDGLTKRERTIEEKKEQERIRKAKELKKQLRRKELGLLQYKWPAIVLLLTGILSIWTEFVDVMIHEPGIGFDSFWSALFLTGNGYFLLPIIAGAFMIFLAIFAYTNPKATFFSIIPALMMIMAGMNVYFLISFGLQIDPEALLMPTGTPLTMLIAGALSLVSIPLRERV